MERAESLASKVSKVIEVCVVRMASSIAREISLPFCSVVTFLPRTIAGPSKTDGCLDQDGAVVVPGGYLCARPHRARSNRTSYSALT